MSNEWISTKDRPPDTDDYILAVIEDYGVWDDETEDIKIASARQNMATYAAIYDGERLTWYDRYGIGCMRGTESHGGMKWTHWMPLPAPPEEEEQK